ncbi:hypothetical protein RHMOL_Rhmol12G0108300 [Rhododendron molle]|uniref:Uncharacterized protein n=1 Tax=Rhododendron molle TaxID=49168 RepID=A0ACC0LGU4_RHOML|nr:hypothetical protein RHMOL_Rhmol12G0108300 [Rhododendron molle]
MLPNDFRKKIACGNAPEFGAIFMSNRSTIKECFERKLFGLPHAFAEFVKEVKAGMILFLFEFQQKKLYGVFWAVSDERMDIVPHAYHSTGKKFPAQHPFTTGTSNLFTSLHENITPSGDAIARSCFSGCQPVPLERESECVGVSSYTTSSCLGNYIPLSSPEQFEPTETAQAFSEATCDGHKDSSLAEACIFPMSFGVRDSTQPSSVHKADGGQRDESSPARQSDSYPRVKGLYSDIPDKKGSVFSRLNFESKASLEKNEDNSEVTESIHEIMKKLQKSHKNWEKANRKTKSVVHGIGDRTLENRSSLFSRLSIASGDVQRKDVKNWNTWRRETGAKVQADGEVCGCSSENRQKKRRLVSLVLRDELDVDTEIRDRWCPEVQMQPQESSAGKKKGESWEGSTRSDKVGDNEIGFPPKDIVLSVIYPTTGDGKVKSKGGA